MTINHSMRSKPVLVGIDIAKNRHEVLIEVPGKKRRRIIHPNVFVLTILQGTRLPAFGFAVWLTTIEMDQRAL